MDFIKKGLFKERILNTVSEVYQVVKRNGLAVSLNSSEIDDKSDEIVTSGQEFEFMFCSSDYSNLRFNGKVSSNQLAEHMSKKLAELINKYNLKFIKDADLNDVRYSVYFHKESDKFLSVCVQDFDIPDYIEENFLRDVYGEIVSFYSSDYLADGEYTNDPDDISEALCDAVCDLLNYSNVKVNDI